MMIVKEKLGKRRHLADGAKMIKFADWSKVSFYVMLWNFIFLLSTIINIKKKLPPNEIQAEIFFVLSSFSCDDLNKLSVI